MTWLKLGDDWYQRPVILTLSADARWLHVAGMGHTMRHLTDRVVAAHVVSMLAPGYRPRFVEELVSAGLWVPFPDPTEGWWIADPMMSEQPTRAEVEAEREGTTARQELSRARNPRKGERADPDAVARAERRVDAARQAIAEAKEARRVNGCRPPWDVTPSVTGVVTRDVTSDTQRESRRPDPTRPGVTTSLSGADVADAKAPPAPVPPVSLAALGVPPPPGRPGRNGRLSRPSDEELLADCRRILSDPTSPPWLVAQTELQLTGLGHTRETALAAVGAEA